MRRVAPYPATHVGPVSVAPPGKYQARPVRPSGTTNGVPATGSSMIMHFKP